MFSRNSSLLLCALFLSAAAGLKAQTVFVSSKGKKYHMENCHGLAPDKRAIAIEEAEKQGYKAHKGCKVKKMVNKQKARPPKEN